MSEERTRKSPEDIEKELSVGKFAAQEATTLGITLGGTAAGAAAGYGLDKANALNKVTRFKIVERIIENGAGKKVLIGGGAAIGLVLGSIASMFGHWKKVERERLSVQEINQDVASLMDKRVKFEETLDAQHGIIKDMLEKQGAKGENRPSHTERLDKQRVESQQAERY